MKSDEGTFRQQIAKLSSPPLTQSSWKVRKAEAKRDATKNLMNFVSQDSFALLAKKWLAGVNNKVSITSSGVSVQENYLRKTFIHFLDCCCCCCQNTC